MKIAAELSHFSQFLLSPQSFLSPRAAVAFRQTKMQRLLLEKELVIGARGSYGLFCQTFLKGHGTFSFSFFTPNAEFRHDAHFFPLDLAQHLDQEGDAALWRKPPVRFLFARCALLRPADVTGAVGGGERGAVRGILVIFHVTGGIETLFAESCARTLQRIRSGRAGQVTSLMNRNVNTNLTNYVKHFKK